MKARFIAGMAEDNGGNLEKQEFAALLSSMSDLVAYNAKDEAKPAEASR